jgi:hypothetical protein
MLEIGFTGDGAAIDGPLLLNRSAIAYTRMRPIAGGSLDKLGMTGVLGAPARHD